MLKSFQKITPIQKFSVMYVRIYIASILLTKQILQILFGSRLHCANRALVSEETERITCCDDFWCNMYVQGSK